MPAAAFIVAALAAAEPPRLPPERPLAMIRTAWSLEASPRAMALAEQERPIFGPGQVVPPPAPPPAMPNRKGEATVLPAQGEEAPKDEFDELKDPAAAAAEMAPAEAAPAPADAAATATAAGEAPAETDAAVDPFEAELAQQIKPANDPLEGFNRVSFAVSMAIDKAVLRPLALGFHKVAPKPARDGLHNVLSNWGAPIIILNDLLQLKPQRAVRSLARFLLNTLLGIGGLFDVAKDKKFNLPHHGNRFGNTLAFWGVKPGPYLYLPILGPTTLRDEADRFETFLPLFDNPIFRHGRGPAMSYLSGLDERANNDQDLKAMLEDAVDPYATFRETWLQDRQGEIDRLKAPDGKNPGDFGAGAPAAPALLDDPLIDPAAPAAAPEPATPAPAAEEAVKPAP